jgi:hypothetical protein
MNLKNRSWRFILNNLFVLAVSVVLFGGLALAAGAQTSSIPSDYGLTATAKQAGLPTGNASPIKIASVFVNFTVGILGAILVILIVYGGFTWMTSAGDEQKITKAKKLMGNAVIGLIIALTAYIITSFIVENLKRGTGYYWGSTNCVGPPPIIPDCNTGVECVDGQWQCYENPPPPPPPPPPTLRPCEGVCLEFSQANSNCQHIDGTCPSGQECFRFLPPPNGCP